MKQVTKKFDNVMDGVKNLIKAANADYCDGTSYDGSKTKSDVRLEMEEKFKNGWTIKNGQKYIGIYKTCLLYTSPSPRDLSTSRMPSSA